MQVLLIQECSYMGKQEQVDSFVKQIGILTFNLEIIGLLIVDTKSTSLVVDVGDVSRSENDVSGSVDGCLNLGQ